jgi:hypothetical protein
MFTFAAYCRLQRRSFTIRIRDDPIQREAGWCFTRSGLARDGSRTKAEPRSCEGGKNPLPHGRDSAWIIGSPGWARSHRARQVLGLGLGAGAGGISVGAGVGGGGGEVVAGISAAGAGGAGVGLVGVGVIGDGVVEDGVGGGDTAESAGVGLTGLGTT